jgi:hypothetical protein
VKRFSKGIGLRRCTVVALAMMHVFATTTSYGQTPTYEVMSCQAPDGVEPSSAGWSTSEDTNDAASFPSLACDGPGLTNSASPYATHARGSTVGLRWTAAPNTSVAAYELDYRVHAYAEAQYQWAWDFRNGIIDAATATPLLLNFCRSAQSYCETQRDINQFTTQRLNGHRARAVYFSVTCAIDRPSDCPAGFASGIDIKSARFTLEDVNPPRITSPPSGELVNSSTIASGSADVRFSASDVGGGLYGATVEVDGVPVLTRTIDEAGGKCVMPFRFPAPCPDTATVAFSYDTRGLPDGPHSVRLIVRDATGENSASYGPVELLTVNGNPPSPDRLQAISCPVSANPAIVVRAEPPKVRYGGVVTVKGRVKQPNAQGVIAVSGLTVGSVSTITALDRAGKFKTQLHPAMSQLIRAALLVPGTSATCSRTIPIVVRAKSTLNASRRRLRNHEALELSGIVRGQLLPTGKMVIIRVRAAGSTRWYRAGTVRSDAAGNWTWKYRFRRTSRKTIYIFKVVVPKEPGFRYAVGHSRSMRVTVLP